MNAEFVFRWTDEAKRQAVLGIRTTKAVAQGVELSIRNTEPGDFYGWHSVFQCHCCVCRGTCSSEDLNNNALTSPMKATDMVSSAADEEAVDRATRDSNGRPGDSITFHPQESDGEGPMSMSGERSLGRKERLVDLSGTTYRRVGDRMEVCFFFPTSQMQVKRTVPSGQ